MAEPTTEAKITALAPWFGSKRTLAPRIVAELGEHRAYWEPFCGSMAVLLVKPACVMETVNDLLGDLINLARVVADDTLGPRLYRRLRRTFMDGELHKECKAVLAAPYDGAIDLERAYVYFVASWLGRAGVAGTRSYNNGFCVRYTANGGHAAKRFASCIDSIPAWRRRLRNVTICREDAFALLPRIDDRAGTAIYVDPPYVAKGAQYVHDFDEDQHRRLADLLRRFNRSRIIVSYYDHPMVRSLYHGWTFVECPVAKALANQGRRDRASKAVAPELLVINGPSYTAPADARILFD